ncbi:hypothetical protein KUTeg_013008 [Tegillarca granosa]|uniref:Uncharacterized protein n=1 Tax=Tegillarca granosa TaxID=220873 RepID=A0ABQ9ESF8_TEGGR|nr:hypothetical protein KUTeg_013008 [Tegillarca granosa]
MSVIIELRRRCQLRVLMRRRPDLCSILFRHPCTYLDHPWNFREVLFCVVWTQKLPFETYITCDGKIVSEDDLVCVDKRTLSHEELLYAILYKYL